MRYEGSVYRPPSEAGSLIIQLTIGCARNTCRFCSMYKDKSFRIRPLDDVVEDLILARSYYSKIKIKRIFLADGDALIVKTADLVYIMEQIKEIFPEVCRISTYGAPKDVIGKTHEELLTLKAAGLDLVYMGAESGDDGVLEYVQKGATAAEISDAGQKLKAAGMAVSMTLISGLGGREHMQNHAKNSAKLISEIKPEYVSFLTLMLEPGAPMYDELAAGTFKFLEPKEIYEELKIFISAVDAEGTIFRSNHASNYISLAGTFNTDKERLLAQIDIAERKNIYKSENYRGL